MVPMNSVGCPGMDWELWAYNMSKRGKCTEKHQSYRWKEILMFMNLLKNCTESTSLKHLQIHYNPHQFYDVFVKQ